MWSPSAADGLPADQINLQQTPSCQSAPARHIRKNRIRNTPVILEELSSSGWQKVWEETCRRTASALSAVEQVIDGGSEPSGLFLTGEVQAYLTVLEEDTEITEGLKVNHHQEGFRFCSESLEQHQNTHVSGERDEVGPAAADGEAVVEFLLKQGLTVLQTGPSQRPHTPRTIHRCGEQNHTKLLLTFMSNTRMK